MKPTLTDVSSKYGAPMGRRGCHPGNAACATGEGTLHAVEMHDGCYDSGGAYWGMGTQLWLALVETEDEILEHYFRSTDPMFDGALTDMFPEIETWTIGEDI